jgi:hypothetical protein
MTDPKAKQTDYRSRDSMSLTITGAFFCTLACLVLIGSILPEVGGRERLIKTLVNTLAGLTLGGLGMVMLALARRLGRQADSDRGPDAAASGPDVPAGGSDAAAGGPDVPAGGSDVPAGGSAAASGSD